MVNDDDYDDGTWLLNAQKLRITKKLQQIEELPISTPGLDDINADCCYVNIDF